MNILYWVFSYTSELLVTTLLRNEGFFLVLFFLRIRVNVCFLGTRIIWGLKSGCYRDPLSPELSEDSVQNCIPVLGKKHFVRPVMELCGKQNIKSQGSVFEVMRLLGVLQQKLSPPGRDGEFCLRGCGSGGRARSALRMLVPWTHWVLVIPHLPSLVGGSAAAPAFVPLTSPAVECEPLLWVRVSDPSGGILGGIDQRR